MADIEKLAKLDISNEAWREYIWDDDTKLRVRRSFWKNGQTAIDIG
jgi:hypothetical protein